ncbi:unnamed protein product [Mycena citricolor]|uniref:Uncharacterized protein n=1 Tax=Mycena citricolor TaxID=2018698 RepID=A0AAD2H839_9AGAR|nr:unnamed protein product [Mycena citricolor]
MDVYVQITGLDSGKTCGVKALLDSDCSTCCIDTDYAQAERLDIQKLPQLIVACDADNTKNISGQITHYCHNSTLFHLILDDLILSRHGIIFSRITASDGPG